MATLAREAARETRSARLERLAAWALVAGCLFPLFKRSLVFDTSALVWPWQLAGLDLGPAERAAIATHAGGDDLALWAVLPLVAGLIAFGVARLQPLRARGAACATVGATMLAVLLLVLVPENAVLGLVFTPPTRGAGALMLAGVATCAFLAASNHVARTAPGRDAPRASVAAAGLGLVALTSVFMLAAEGAWAAWPIRLLCLLVVVYGILALGRAARPQHTPAITVWSSTLARVILGWSILAVVLAQRAGDDGFVTYVVEAGGGPLPTAIGAVKGFLIFTGAALLLAAGLATTLEARWMAPRPHAR